MMFHISGRAGGTGGGYAVARKATKPPPRPVSWNAATFALARQYDLDLRRYLEALPKREKAG